MKTLIGHSNWIIDINLSTGSVASFQVSEKDRRNYLGGKGLGLKLLYERMDRGIDPLGEKNILAFLIDGIMGTVAPCTDGFSVVTKSPLTGLMLHSSCGGPFGKACQTAGFDGLLVSGKASGSVVLVVDQNDTYLEDGSAFWGLDVDEAEKRLNPDGKAGVLTIGPAGENQVWIANAASGHRFFGRGGVGAVMGSKNLKAIVVKGNAYHFVPSHPKRFAKAEKKAFAFITASASKPNAFCESGVERYNGGSKLGDALPVESFGDGRQLLTEERSDGRFQAHHPSRPSACRCTSIFCRDLNAFSDRLDECRPETETIAMSGPHLGIDDPHHIASFHDHCNRLGLDSISATAILAWCMEAGEKGLIDTNLKFGVAAGILAALEDMAYRRGFGDDMANGTRSLSNQYGGRGFATHVKGLEIPAHDPRSAWGHGLARAVANGDTCHPAAAMGALEDDFHLLAPHSVRAKVHWVRFLDDLFAIVNSLCSCPLIVYVILFRSPMVRWAPKWLLKAMLNHFPGIATMFMDVGSYAKLWRSVTGIKLNRWQLLNAGARIHVLERIMNSGEGISRKDDTLPRRLLGAGREEDDGPGMIDLQPMIDAYYRMRGYDLRGIPTSKTCKRLDIPLLRPADADPRLAHFKMTSPGPRPLQWLYLSAMLWFMGRAIEAASKADRQVRALFDALPNGLTFALTVAPHGPAMVLAKDKGGKVRYLDSTITDRYIDLTLTIKNMDMAMLLFTFREAIVTAVARDRLIVTGDIPTASILVRILEQVAVILLPKMLAVLSVRRYPDWSTSRKIMLRTVIYLRALAGI